MARQGDGPRGVGRSTYKGLRVTVVQAPGDRPAILTVAVKPEAAGWDEWHLLFPALRVPHRELVSSGDVLALLAEVVEDLLSKG